MTECTGRISAWERHGAGLVRACLLLWMPASMISIMAYGAPGVEPGPIAWVVLILIWTYPLVALPALFAADRFRQAGHARAARWAVGIPLAIVGGVTLVILGFFVAYEVIAA